MAITLQPVEQAVARLSERTPVGSMLRSAEWARVPVELRERAQFSSGVESARLLQHIQDGLEDILAATRDSNGVIANRGDFLARLGQLAEAEGIRPTDPELRGGIQDIGSRRRGELIYDMQVGQAYGHADWKAGQDADEIDAVPAQELVRVIDSRVKRDWPARWQAAGGRLFGGRMVALKTDPVWTAISRFGTPWPPFDFNSGMDVEDVLREEAEELGLIPRGAAVPVPEQPGFNDTLQARVSGLQPGMLDSLLNIFGDQIAVEGDVIRWRGGQA